MHKKNNIIKLTNLLFEVGTLRKIVRAHRQRFLTDDLSDNIASHSFRVAIVGYFLAEMEKVDAQKVTLMCLFHDVQETRTNDLNWIHRKYVKVFEDEILNDQIIPVKAAAHLVPILNEYEERKSKESIVAKDADIIDQVLLIREYAYTGNKEAERWEKDRRHEKMVQTASAKKLLKEIYLQNPSEWAQNISSSQRRK